MSPSSQNTSVTVRTKTQRRHFIISHIDEGFDSIALPNSLSLSLSLPKFQSVRHSNTTHSPSSFISMQADACHGSSDVSCLLTCRPRLAVVQRHIQQGLCNTTACSTTGPLLQWWWWLGWGGGLRLQIAWYRQIPHEHRRMHAQGASFQLHGFV